MNILITSAGKRASLTKIFQKELTNNGLKSKVFTTDMNPVLSPACNISDGYFKVSPAISDLYVDQVLNICRRCDVKMVIPTIDTELKALTTHKKRFKDAGIYIVISSSKFIDICRDKRKTNTFFNLHGIETPAIVDKLNPTFPLFIKPYDGSLSVDTFKINSSSELTDYQLGNEKFMFMEYINQEEYSEYTVDLYYDKNSTLKCIIPRKRLSIRSGEVSKALTCNNMIVKYLNDRLEIIDGAIGCLTLQVFFNESVSHIIGIEINPRFGGGFPLSYLAGGNYPGWLIKEYLLEEEIHFYDSWEADLLMLRYDDEILVHGYKG